MDNEEASIQVGKEVPFSTGTYTSTGTTVTNPFQTIQRQNVGLNLTVTPQINEGNAIRLDINQEVSSLLPTTENAVDLVTSKRQIKTSVLVQDGHMIILGGLIDESDNETYQKVPILGDIPLIGNLFRYQKVERSKRNLMVFIRPRILREQGLADQISHAKYRYLRAEQLDRAQKASEDNFLRNSVLNQDDTATLPPLEEWLNLPPPFEETSYFKRKVDQNLVSDLTPAKIQRLLGQSSTGQLNGYKNKSTDDSLNELKPSELDLGLNQSIVIDPAN